ncbi:MAG: adenosylcobinamide-GDP ribazoletransferase [Lachnospiraceae bacterium]|nr:adenosylcobinamide-GDP ribazoletransferase [Lachnospiraceae bacterium]
MLKGFRLTLGFLTRIPVNINWEVKDGELEKGIVYFPIVGLVLGAVCALVYQLTSFVFPVPMSILFGMLTLVFLTGAFHVDGFADTADGIYSARTRERMLEIMRDSRVGTNGMIAIFFDFAFRYLGLWMVSQMFNKPMWIIFLLLPVSGKMVQGMLGYHAVYAREKGLGLFIGTISGKRVLICSILGILFLTLGCGIWGLAAAIGDFILIYLFRKYIEQILGGITGDVMGAANELAEIGFLLFLFISMQLL